MLAPALDDLLGRLAEARAGDPTPVFLKVAPDLTAAEIQLIVEAALDHGVWGMVLCSNAAPHHPMWADEAWQLRMNRRILTAPTT